MRAVNDGCDCIRCKLHLTDKGYEQSSILVRSKIGERVRVERLS